MIYSEQQNKQFQSLLFFLEEGKDSFILWSVFDDAMQANTTKL